MKHFQAVLISWGPLGLFTLAIIESLGIPNPGGTDALLLLLTVEGANPWVCATCAAAGSLIGTTIFFELMRRGGERYLARYTSSGRGAYFRSWFIRYGLTTVFVSALLPIPFLPFKIFAGCAGAMGVSRKRLILVLIAGRIPRYAGLAYLGAILGVSSAGWLKSHVWHMVAIAVLLLAMFYVIIRWLERKRIQ
jgi:membrane protein DedA with SNARE-associated domain